MKKRSKFSSRLKVDRKQSVRSPVSSKFEQQARIFKRREIELQKKIAALGKEIADLNMNVRNREHEIQLIYSSRSWRLTVPLRKISSAAMPIRQRLHLGTKWRYIRQIMRALLGPSYQTLCERQARVLKSQAREIQTHIELMAVRPSFSVIIDARSGECGLEETIRSLRAQLYTDYSITVLVNPNKPLQSLQGIQFVTDLKPSTADGEFLVFLECGQCLAPNAVYEFASALNADAYDLIYADEDSISRFGRRHTPFYKPGWSPDYLETFNYVGFAACFRKSLSKDQNEFVSQYDFVLSFTEQPCRIHHIAQVLGHRTHKNNSAKVSDVGPLSRRLGRTDRLGQVSPHKTFNGCFEITIKLKTEPLISVVIPTAGKTIVYGKKSVDLITNVIREIKEKSTYKNLQFIVVHNGNLAEAQVLQLSSYECKLVPFLDRELNIPKKLNLGAQQAAGDILLLMNDDIEVVEPAWIERMVEHFEKPHVGVVGARLTYPDGKLQHAGVVHNYGNPDHVRRMFDSEEAGYFYSTCGVKNYLAVTGAVMMTRASTYRAVGGYSEKLAVSFNDVDYCLRVKNLGLTTVYAPAAKLVHLESQTRDPTLNKDELLWFYSLWGSETNPDPFYNERFLTVAPPTFVPTVNPRMI
ncbi:glycosyltransferase family 2 protein [Afipia sp. DC4300-2b1]|uniref:glycosyltransferase family 2 protein n=1 Tax=Afipia sp. DC4300-2b1 TaxID=2804672 RepID=UPI003CFA7C21